MIDFSQDYFALFGLPARYRFDPAELDAAYRKLQTEVHPDRFAAAGDDERRLALQSSSRVNEAYRALRSPLERAHYLLLLRGIDALAEILSPKADRVRRWLADLLSFLFCLFFSWKSWTLVREAIHEGQVTQTTWAPPLWIPYGMMALGMSVLTLQLLLQLTQKRRH